MSSAEVFSWGTLVATSSHDKHEQGILTPLETARRYLVQHVHAGLGTAVLTGAKRVEWLPECVRPTTLAENSDDDGFAPPSSSSFSGVDSAAFGQHHTLLLRNGVSDGDSGGNASSADECRTTVVLAYGSGRQGQVG